MDQESHNHRGDTRRTQTGCLVFYFRAKIVSVALTFVCLILSKFLSR
ncbi:MAG: hypothetical protein ACR2JR_05705 [Rubrobacteraceae bacterium]